MTERSEVHVTVGCSPRSGEPLTGAGSHDGDRSRFHDKMVHQ
jgi:hypothetical protein